MPDAPSRKRKEPPRAREPSSYATTTPASTFDAMNVRANCAWQVAHPNQPSRPPDAADPNQSHKFEKTVSICYPPGRPGDLFVLTLNDGFVADNGAFVWPNSLYIFSVPDHDGMLRNVNHVNMTCHLPVVSWHKRNDPLTGQPAWVFTDHGQTARIASIAVYAAQEGMDGIMEVYTVQQTITVHENVAGCVTWPKEAEPKRSLVSIGRQDKNEVGTSKMFREWMAARSRACNNSAFDKVCAHVYNGARLSPQPRDGHLQPEVVNSTSWLVDAWAVGTIESSAQWKALGSGRAVVWRPPMAHPKAHAAFAIAGQAWDKRTQFCIWSDHIAAIWFHPGPSLGEGALASALAYVMRVDYTNPEKEKKHMIVGFESHKVASEFLRTLDPIPGHIEVHTRNTTLAPAHRQPVAPPSAAASDDPHRLPPAERDSLLNQMRARMGQERNDELDARTVQTLSASGELQACHLFSQTPRMLALYRTERGALPTASQRPLYTVLAWVLPKWRALTQLEQKVWLDKARRSSRVPRPAPAPVPAAAPAAAPEAAPKPPPPRPKMPTGWLALKMPTGKFAAPAFHPFTEDEVHAMRNRYPMARYLPKLRDLLPPQPSAVRPKITDKNYEREVIDKILALCPQCECKDAKAVWKRNLVAEINTHRYSTNPKQEKGFELYKESDPWHAVVDGANGFDIAICAGLDGGPPHPLLGRVELHNLRVAREAQQKAVAEWHSRIRKWDEEHAEVFESRGEVSYEEAFRRKDAKLRMENMVVLD